MRRILLLASFGLAALGVASAGQPHPLADRPAGTIVLFHVARCWLGCLVPANAMPKRISRPRQSSFG
jgi:hypothetical protein